MSANKASAEGSTSPGIDTESGGSAATVKQSTVQRQVEYLQTDIDFKRANPISIWACFLTGWTVSPSFSVSLSGGLVHMAISADSYQRPPSSGVASRRESAPPSYSEAVAPGF